MSDQRRPASVSLPDLAWRTIYRLGFPLARAWWRLRRPHHRGALVAIRAGGALLLLRSSYRRDWNFPGGSIRTGETPVQAARRELAEEIGLAAPTLVPAGSACGIWDGRRDHVSFFELHLEVLPRLHLDHREIVEARLWPPAELQHAAVTGPVAAYLRRARPTQ